MDRGIKLDQVQNSVNLCRERGIESGMFLMWGYEGEEIEDVEATIKHVSATKPDIFFTTVSYPVKGTPYYKQVQDRLVQLRPWSQTSDRDLKIKGRHSRQFYAHADKLLHNEVQLARLVNNPASNSKVLADLRDKIQMHRANLLSSNSEVEA
jgi:anaerobic magnesium-protoporphyrin IX monomethyl ester cyclase